MVFGYSQPQEPSRVSSLHEYVCCASWFSLCITERSPAGPCIWKVMSLPLALIRPTDSSRNCLSCWVLVPTESTRKAEPSPALSAWSAARKARLSLDLSTGGGETETGLHGDSVKNADSRIRCLLEMLAQQSHAPLQKAVEQSVLPGGPQSSSTHPFQISLDKRIRCK